MSRVRLLTAIALGAAALAVAPASAHDQTYPSKVTIREVEDFDYRGAVISDLVACERGRRVKIYHAQSGEDEYIADAEANEHGRWRFAFSGDRYYAKVPRVTLMTSSGHHHVCGSDTSPTV